MKILVLSSGSYKSILALRVVALAQNLAKQGNEVTLMAPSADKYNDFTPDANPQLEHVTVAQPWQLTTHSPLVNLLPYIFSSFFMLLFKRADIIYLCKPTPVTILGLLPRLLFRTPVILDLDDLGSEVMKSQGQSPLQYKLVAWCERFATRYANGIVVVSTYLERLVNAQYPRKEVVVIPNGVEPNDYPVVENVQPRNAIYYFGAVNRLSLIETLIEAVPMVIKAIPDTMVTIVGGGSALPDAKRMVKKLSIDSSVAFTGWVPFLGIQKYVQPGDIAVCYQPDTTTVKAASNMKVFQYMAMSTIPVVSSVGDLPLYVHDGQLGEVVLPGDVARLAESLIRLLKNNKGRVQMAKCVRKAAETEYAWESHASKLNGFMMTILEKTRRSV